MPGGTRPPVDQTGKTPCEDQQHQCDCGKRFHSSTALAVHKRVIHGIHSEVYELVAGTICPICLKQFWTENRLRAHLMYVPRAGCPNLCYGLLKWTANGSGLLDMKDDNSRDGVASQYAQTNYRTQPNSCSTHFNSKKVTWGSWGYHKIQGILAYFEANSLCKLYLSQPLRLGLGWKHKGNATLFPRGVGPGVEMRWRLIKLRYVHMQNGPLKALQGKSKENMCPAIAYHLMTIRTLFFYAKQFPLNETIYI